MSLPPCPACGGPKPFGPVFCHSCYSPQMENHDGHRRAPEEADRDSDSEGGERPGTDATGTAVALTGEDAGAGSGENKLTAEEIIELATDRLSAIRWQVTGQAGGGGGGRGGSGGSSHWATALSQQQAQYLNPFGSAGIIKFPAQNSIANWGNAVLTAPATATPPKPVEDGGIVVGEIVAWRCWRVALHGVLHSMSAGSYVWTPGEPATTEGGMKLEPHQMCYGVHAWKTCRDAMAYAAAASPSAIVGKILLSGIVIEHERGYRAECGQIESLDWIVSELPARVANDLLSKARAMYGVGGISGALKPVAVATVHGPIVLRCLFWAAIALNLGMVALNLLKVLS